MSPLITQLRQTLYVLFAAPPADDVHGRHVERVGRANH